MLIFFKHNKTNKLVTITVSWPCILQG